MAYNYVKITKMRQEAQEQLEVSHDGFVSPLNSSGSDGEGIESEEESAGLLQSHVENSESLVTSDGDIHTNLLPLPSQDAEYKGHGAQ